MELMQNIYTPEDQRLPERLKTSIVTLGDRTYAEPMDTLGKKYNKKFKGGHRDRTYDGNTRPI